jgi:phage terminase small subunit
MTITDIKKPSLTQKQERFTRFLFDGLSQRESWIKAGYSDKYAVTIIDVHACQLANSDKVKVRLAELNKKADDDSVATHLEACQVATEVIRAKLGDFISADGRLLSSATLKSPAIAEYSIKQKKYGVDTTVKLHDPLDGIEKLARLKKWYEAQPTNNTINNTMNIIVMDGQTKDLISQIKNRTAKLIEANQPPTLQ